MVFLKNIEVNSIINQQRGLFAKELIKSGEKLWSCDCFGIDISFTREQLLKIISQKSHLEYFIRSYSYVTDEDLIKIPPTYNEQKFNDECSLFNHSCDPNAGFTGNGTADVRIRCFICLLIFLIY